MPTRREVMLWVGVTALTNQFSAAQEPSARKSSRLETLLFNLSDDGASGRSADLIENVKERLRTSGASGFLLGRNMIPTPFPTRFELICMVQTEGDTSLRRVQEARDRLVAQCRNFVQCDVDCRPAAGFIEAATVKVRHCVMFNFKPDAPAAARDRIVAAIRGMGRLPMVQNYLVEPSVDSAAAPNQMQWQVIGDFASVADYRSYSDAPVHLAIRDDFTAHTSRVAFLDMEL